MSKRPSKFQPIDPHSGESPAADSITVVWMLFVAITLVCELSLVAALFYVRAHPDAKSIAALAGVLYFTSVLAGLIAICLVPVVLKSRRAPPPLPITIFALVVGAAPLVAMVVSSLS